MRSFVVTVDAADADLAADRLWQLGVRAIEERTDGECVELWTVVGDDPAAVESAAETLDAEWRWRVEEQPTDWTETWRDHARPVEIGDRLVVVPSWLAGEGGRVRDGRVTILIEPGAAFGLGDHPTTSLTLAAVDREMSGLTSPRVLDIGCGTGVLSIAAALLGAGTVRGVDVSVAAVESAARNIRDNGLDGQIDVDDTPVGELDGAYDLVFANILAPALVAMAPDLRRLTAPHGRLVISGVLDGGHAHVLAALDPMQPMCTDVAAGWAAVTMRHRR